MEKRQQQLLDLIKGNARGLTVKEICECLPTHYKYNPSESNYTNCPQLYKDIDVLNSDPAVAEIIIKDNNCFKVGSENECKGYAKKLQVRALKSFKKYWDVVKKANRDGELDLIKNEFIRAFSNENE